MPPTCGRPRTRFSETEEPIPPPPIGEEAGESELDLSHVLDQLPEQSLQPRKEGVTLRLRTSKEHGIGGL